MAKAAFTSKQFAEALEMNEAFNGAELTTTDFVGSTDVTMDMATEVAENMVIEALDTDTVEIEEIIGGDCMGPEYAEVDQVVHTSQDFEARLAAISEEDALQTALHIAAQIDERADFERSTGNETIQKHLAKSRKQLATPRAARVVIACNVDINEINRSVHEGARYNVYALGKLADAINALSGGVVGNAINHACMKSLFQFRAGGVEYNGEMAKASASDKIRVDVGVRGMLVRHTVAASTASTQASSTMQALTTLGIVERSGSTKNPTFTLANSDVVAKLQAVLAA